MATTLRGLTLIAATMAVSALALGQEALGPFESWANVKRDYGAVGDGVADDTAALQRALDDLRRVDRPFSVLYLPAGVYRITRTIELRREAHSESQGVSIFGEHADATRIVWDGEPDGVMMHYNPWYSAMGRLTFDGRGKAKTAIQHGPAFTTANELSDLVIKDVAFGIEAGIVNGIAETAVERCRFGNCTQAGISIQNWNSLDWWIWECQFEGCRLGVTNTFGAGNFHVYQCLFRGSTEADIAMGNTMHFAFRDNVSVGSKAFLVAGVIGAGAPTVLQRNLILDPQDVTPIRIGNMGTVQLLDNVVRRRDDAGPAIADTSGALVAVSMGNRVTAKEPLRVSRRLISIDDRTIEPERGQGNYQPPALPVPPPSVTRRVIEVPKDAGAQAIQEAVDRAAADATVPCVIHIPAGTCKVAQTIEVPGNLDVVITGDGILNATHLRWEGSEGGPVFRLHGPSRAMIRDLLIDGAGRADGILVEGCDQEGAQITGNQLDLAGDQVGLLVPGLTRTAVNMRNFQHAGCEVGLKVVGNGEGQPTSQVVVFCGASSNNQYSYEVTNGGRLLVRDIWYESGQSPTFMRCTDAGQFTMQLGNIALTRASEAPSVLVEGFRGRVAFLGTDFAGTPLELPGLVVRGDSPQAEVLALGVHGDGDYFRNESPNARAALIASHRRTPGGGAEDVADVGTADNEMILRMFEQTRSQGPHHWRPSAAGVTDVRFHRIFVTNAVTGVALRP